MTLDDDARWVRDRLQESDPVAGLDKELKALVGEVRDDLRARIRSPSVDSPNSEWGAQLRPGRRNRTFPSRGRVGGGLWAVAAGLVLLLGVAGTIGVMSLDGGDGDAVTASGDDPGPGETETLRSFAAADGVELRLVTSGPVVAGTRTPATFTIRNAGQSPIYWQAGGCGDPVVSVLGPAGYVPPPADADRTWWDGTLPSLEPWVDEHNALPLNAPHQAEDATGHRSRFCTAESDMDEIEPGAEVVHDGSFEARVPPGPLPAGGDYAVTSTFTWYSSASDYPDEPGTSVTSTIAVEVLDDPERSELSAVDALNAATASPLGDWVEFTQLTATSPVDQAYSVELSWWRSEWELWVTPQYFNAGTRPLRLRYDPTSGAISNVRTVQSGQPPADEPGARLGSSAPPDELLLTAPAEVAAPEQLTPTTDSDSRPAVPDLVGMDMGQAYETMIAAGFDPAADATLDSAWVANDTAQEGTIISQEPSAGRVLEPGGRVNIIVSAGGPVIAFGNLPEEAARFATTLEGFDPNEPILQTGTEGGVAYKTDKWLFGPCPAVRLAFRTYGDPSYGDSCY